MKVVDLKPDMTSALSSLDDLRAMVASGEVHMFCAVGIEKNDNTRMWVGSCGSKSKLQLIGALTHLLFSYWHNDIK